jgi:hypothetical protein
MNEVNYFVTETTSGIPDCSGPAPLAILAARILLFTRGEHEPDLFPRGISTLSNNALSSFRGSWSKQHDFVLTKAHEELVTIAIRNGVLSELLIPLIEKKSATLTCRAQNIFCMLNIPLTFFYL